MNKTMQDLVEAFNYAKKYNYGYIIIRIEMEGFPESEHIINGNGNFDKKLAYYQEVYDENLNHKFSKGIKIAEFQPANVDDIEEYFRLYF